MPREKIWRMIVRIIIVIIITLLFTGTSVKTIAHAAQSAITVTYPYYGFVENPEKPWETVFDALDETGTVEYSDDFFLDPSPGNHPKLRAMSYALALAGFENQADGYPSSGSDTNPKLVGLLNQLGFSDYQFFDESSETDGHSVGTTIGHKTLASGQELIVVAPRNYNYMTEWLSNFNVGTSGDHAGFSESAGFIVERLNQYLNSRTLTNYKLWIVGYSRGGAVVDLAAKHINAHISDYSMTADDFYVYTFGAPRASVEETKHSNIHDVKDGNDLILGYMFPESWGFYNTGVYEEIHPADLEVNTSIVNISDLADSTRAMNVLSDNTGLVEEAGTTSGKAFMDDWLEFMIAHGLTREYFDTNIKPSLSAIMQAYQLRTIDKQSEFTGFITDTSNGLAGMVAGNAFIDLLVNYGGDLSAYPAYLDLVKMLKGTATDADVDELVTVLTYYVDEYENYEARLSQPPTITKSEFTILKENLPKLIKALAPLIIADAKYTQETFGEDYSLYYTYTLVSNAENLVIGHIPESIMPILKSLIPADEPEEDVPVPNAGAVTKTEEFASEGHLILNIIPVIILGIVFIRLYRKCDVC